jgi:hypothetical protein
MMCGWQYQELAEKAEEKERSCPKCRSNSIRLLKPKRAPAGTKEEGHA